MLSSYITYLRDFRNYSPRTVESYQFNLSRFFEFFGLDGSVENCASVSPRMIMDFVYSLRELEVSPRSVNQNLSSIRSFYDYLIRFHGVKQNPATAIANLKFNKFLPKFITADKMNDILDNHLPAATWKQSRSRFIVFFLYHTGVRASELCSLKWSDIDLTNDSVRVFGKGSKERIIPFGQELHRELLQWRSINSSYYLVCTQEGAALTSAQLRLALSAVLLPLVGRECSHPHVLRHSFATAMLNGGASLIAIQRILGHSSLESTAVYLHLDLNQVKSQYKLHFR